ncbi:tail fiber protein [Paenibacillus aurantius]|uniref:Tail fiber protein n=1 Tax=Paenibacillus aurantius TaxID=2918900 RepID=A0AA96LJC3_9BACL|nr:tail fiber protein [Paenibacillus aurantius]WNQ13160.1 tail fiber protein [Paenibacillus aurantius]
MSQPFIGEIQAFAFTYAPRGWAQCNGQMLPINQNQALFSILGVTYGGDGVTTFALPDLRGRVPVHVGNGVTLGQSAGEEAHVLTVNEMPAHIHGVVGSTKPASQVNPAGQLWAVPTASMYGATPTTTMAPSAMGSAGSSQAHANMQPYSVLNYCISISGIFPTRD